MVDSMQKFRAKKFQALKYILKEGFFKRFCFIQFQDIIFTTYQYETLFFSKGIEKIETDLTGPF